MWEITKYNGVHTCVAASVHTDHSKLDISMIAAEIEMEVKIDPSIKIKSIQAKIESKYGYCPSYYKAWAGKQKVIARGFDNGEESYTDLAP